jgi:hypothetical protein
MPALSSDVVIASSVDVTTSRAVVEEPSDVDDRDRRLVQRAEPDASLARTDAVTLC